MVTFSLRPHVTFPQFVCVCMCARIQCTRACTCVGWVGKVTVCAHYLSGVFSDKDTNLTLRPPLTLITSWKPHVQM